MERIFDSLYEGDELAVKKAEAFDKIADLFYNRNFGSASKAEIELLMFSILMDGMIHKHSGDNNVMDMNACSDFNMAKMLGIPKTTVKNLKLKKQARYPVEFDWRESLKSVVDSIRYDQIKKKIIIPTPDPNLYEEIGNYIEEKGGFVELQHSRNYIQIRPEYYLWLLYEGIDDEKTKVKVRTEIAEKLKEKNADEDFDALVKSEEALSKQLLSGSSTLLEVVIEVLSCAEHPLTAVAKGTKHLIDYINDRRK